jgi:MarR-like DNA-binding transcriptional regulator SgrR of sgrS sRNA
MIHIASVFCSTAVIGAGPYKLVGWKSGDYLLFDAYDNHFAGKLKIKHIKIRIIQNSSALIGHRKRNRNLLTISPYDKGSYDIDVLDTGCGAADVLFYRYKDRNVMIAVNRETDEIAMYTLQ